MVKLVIIKAYDEMTEQSRLNIASNMHEFMTTNWKEAIYHYNRWYLSDETKGYSAKTVEEGMELSALTYNTLIPWFHNNYGLEM